ncbi:hypothetical protein D3C77_618920 [compost metagenome]
MEPLRYHIPSELPSAVLSGGTKILLPMVIRSPRTVNEAVALKDCPYRFRVASIVVCPFDTPMAIPGATSGDEVTRPGPGDQMSCGS